MPTCNCINCNAEIADEVFQPTYCDPRYPTIPIGPFCPACYGTLRVCSNCRHPTMVANQNTHNFPKTSRFISDKWLCTDCSQNIVLCHSCDRERVIYKEVDGVKMCQDCYNRNYRHCNCCEGDHLVEDMVSDNLSKAKWKGIFRKYGVGNVCKVCFEKKKPQFKEYDISECRRCGNLHSDKDCGGYCKSCYSKIPTCDVCGTKEHNIASTFVNGSYKKICRKCLVKFTKCSRCDSLTTNPTRVTNTTGTYHLCESCNHLKFCPSCRSFEVLDETFGVCERCLDTYHSNKCGTCGSIMDFDKRCRVCSRAQIYQYSSKPRVVFHMLEKEVSPIMFGIENEVTFPTEAKRSNALKILYKHNDPTILLAKRDGSIHGDGYEIVTQPMSLKFFNKFDLTSLFSKDMEYSESCGMHVHVSRKAFTSDVHILKVVSFIHDQEKFINKIVGRDYNNYNARLNKKPSANVLECKGKGGSRSCRVNLTNTVTVEFRMFAGCVEENVMRMRVEFLHALISWTKAVSIKEAKDVDSLVKYIKSGSKLYPNISKFMETI